MKTGQDQSRYLTLVIKMPYIGLVNVVAGKRIVPEFLQYEAKPQHIAEYMIMLLRDKKTCSSMKEEFLNIKNFLGEPGASKRAAGEVIAFLKSKTKKAQS